MLRTFGCREAPKCATYRKDCVLREKKPLAYAASPLGLLRLVIKGSRLMGRNSSLNELHEYISRSSPSALSALGSTIRSVTLPPRSRRCFLHSIGDIGVSRNGGMVIKHF